MIKYEFKKILKNNFFIVFLMIFIAADILLIYKNEYQRINEKRNDNRKNEEEAYNHVKGIMTNEKFDYAKSINPDELIYGGSDLYKDMVSALNYKDEAQKIYDRAMRNAESYESIGKYHAAYKNKQIAKAFFGREINEYYRQEGVDNYLTYDYSTLMTIIMVLIAVVALFFTDNYTGMYRIVKTSKYGQRCICLLRMMTVAVTGVVLMCFFRLIEYIEYYIIYEFDGLHMPVYSVEEYAQTLYDFSIGEFFLIDIGLKCIGIILFILIAIALANIIKSQNTALVAFVMIYAGFVTVSLKSEKIYTPIRLFDGYSLIKSTEFISIGRFNLACMEYTIFITIVLMAAMMLLIMAKGKR